MSGSRQAPKQQVEVLERSSMSESEEMHSERTVIQGIPKFQSVGHVTLYLFFDLILHYFV